MADETKKLREQDSARLDALNEVHSAGQMLLQLEANRLRRKHGAQDPRVLQIEARLLNHQKTRQNLQVEQDAVPPEVEKTRDDEVVIYGRVHDKRLMGVSDLEVTLEDDKGQVVRAAGTVKTSASGQYEMRISPSAAAKLAGQELYLSVSAPNQKVVLRETEPLTFEKGAVVSRDLSLDVERRQAAAPVPRTPRPMEPVRPPEVGEWTAAGRVVDPKGKPAAGLMVKAYDRDRRYDDLLGAALTNKEGVFKITFRTQAFREGDEPGPDLFVVIEDADGNELHATELRLNATKEEVFEIRLGAKDGPKDTPETKEPGAARDPKDTRPAKGTKDTEK